MATGHSTGQEPEVVVTNINGRYHIRVIQTGHVRDEMAVEDRRDIGWACREVLRWQAKLGSTADVVLASRQRNTIKQQSGANSTQPHGRVWYKVHLDEERG